MDEASLSLSTMLLEEYRTTQKQMTLQGGGSNRMWQKVRERLSRSLHKKWLVRRRAPCKREAANAFTYKSYIDQHRWWSEN
mmetsp:Transcript_1528/g.2449  ORF Transcript_1528/g.2449 Transcript_1528/m.2449 type:complete len:81 (-) Transcript_1528:2258-2500(-)